MKRALSILIPGGFALASLMACDPIPAPAPPPPPPPVVSAAQCGQTINDHVIVTTVADAPRCPAAVGQRRIVVDEPCGPLMPGTIWADDCMRGNMTQRPGRALFGPVIARRGSFLAGDTAVTFIASDYWAPAPFTQGGAR